MFCNLRGMAKKEKERKYMCPKCPGSFKKSTCINELPTFPRRTFYLSHSNLHGGRVWKKTERKKKELGVRELESMRLRKP